MSSNIIVQSLLENKLVADLAAHAQHVLDNFASEGQPAHLNDLAAAVGPIVQAIHPIVMQDYTTQPDQNAYINNTRDISLFPLTPGSTEATTLFSNVAIYLQGMAAVIIAILELIIYWTMYSIYTWNWERDNHDIFAWLHRFN